MKTHSKKKLYRASLQAEMKAGMINNADGKFVNRALMRDSSMVRDYHPQMKGKGKGKKGG